MLTTPPSLLERLRQSPEQATWERFVGLYTPLLYAWARRVGLRAAEAADLIQDVFAVLVEKLPTFQYDPERSFRAWLRTLLMNRWRQHVRRRQLEQRVLDHTLTDEIAEEEQTPEFEAEEYRRYLAGRALELMQAEFQPSTWKAFWEFVVHDRPAAEVAAELGLSVNAVYLARGRVLTRLRQELVGMFE
jgi:RNA polymerase sigma-70 factor (ECF subfamily)